MTDQCWRWGANHNQSQIRDIGPPTRSCELLFSHETSFNCLGDAVGDTFDARLRVR